MNVTIRQLIVGSIPTLAVILGFFWFRRKKKNPAIEWKDEGEEVDNSKNDIVVEAEEAKPAEVSSTEEIEVQPVSVTTLTAAAVIENGEKSSSSIQTHVTAYNLESQIIPDAKSTGDTTTPLGSDDSDTPILPSRDLVAEQIASDLSFTVKQEFTAEVLAEPKAFELKTESLLNEAAPSPRSSFESGDQCDNKVEISKASAAKASPDRILDWSEAVNDVAASGDAPESLIVATKVKEVKIEPQSCLTSQEVPSKPKSADENANVGPLPSKISEVTKTEPVDIQSLEQESTEKNVKHEISPALTNGDIHANGDISRVRNGSGESAKDRPIKTEQNHTPTGECDHTNSDAQSEVSSDSGRGASGIETPTATSPNELNEYTVYEFDFPTDACGRLIGRSGKNINSLKAQTGTEIILRRLPGNRNYQTCSIEGTQSQVRAALELIKSRFAAEKYGEISYEQTNCLDESPMLMPQVMQLNLPEGVSLDVIVSSVVDANHVFVQQVTHPTFPSLEKLGQFMIMCYGQEEVPELPRPIETGMICAAPMFTGWYRAMVTATYPDTDEVEVKYIDYGGYMQVNASLLRQIRTDFMGLPFQATECFLANVVPLSDQEGFGVEASALLESLVQGNLLQAQIVGRAEDGSPYIELYSTSGPQPVFVNRELVNMGVARWYEMQA